jgi:carbon-monoxide dehydrogenase medium subunit
VQWALQRVLSNATVCCVTAHAKNGAWRHSRVAYRGIAEGWRILGQNVPFEYRAPTRLEDAVALLGEHGLDARVLAGGTDLLIAMRERGLRPSCVIDLKRIAGLSDVTPAPDGGLRLGALVALRAIEVSALIAERFPILSRTAALMGSVQLRNKSTVGGNICNASPAADLVPPLMVLDASVTMVGPAGERTLPLVDLFSAGGGTCLNGEILTSIHVPPMPARARAVYLKHSPRDAMDFTMVGVAVLASPDAAGRTFDDVRIALASVAPTGIRVPSAERALCGATIDAESIARAAAIAADDVRPAVRRAWRGSAEYRQAMIRTLLTRALMEAAL